MQIIEDYDYSIFEPIIKTTIQRYESRVKANKKWVAKNKEHVIEYQKEYHKNRRLVLNEKSKERAKEWYKKNKEVIKQKRLEKNEIRNSK